MITVWGFLDWCVDKGMLELELWDNVSDTVVYSGNAEEMPEEFEEIPVDCWDVPTEAGKITINISLYDESEEEIK